MSLNFQNLNIGDRKGGCSGLSVVYLILDLKRTGVNVLDLQLPCAIDQDINAVTYMPEPSVWTISFLSQTNQVFVEVKKIFS